MEAKSNGNGIWRTLAVGSASSLVTVIFSVVAFYSRTVSQSQVSEMIKSETPSILSRTVDRDEVLRLIKSEAPWLSDRADVTHRIERIEQSPWFADKSNVEHRLQMLEQGDLLLNSEIQKLHSSDSRLEGEIMGLHLKGTER